MESEFQSHLLCFDEFELDLRTRELRQQARLIKLQDMPVRLLILLATRAGELVTREEIEQELWGDDHFVDFDHGINTAMRKVREALGESPETPRYIETLPRKGYRFIATVQRGSQALGGNHSEQSLPVSDPQPESAVEVNGEPVAPQPESAATPVSPSGSTEALPSLVDPVAGEREFSLPSEPARRLFLLIQAGFLLMYCVALFKLDDAGRVIEQVFAVAQEKFIPGLIAVAVCGIAVRLFLLTSVLLRHPAAGLKFRRLFPAVLLLDILWAASPLLLVEKLGVGLAIGAIAGLAYLPFSQRILMMSIYPGD